MKSLKQCKEILETYSGGPVVLIAGRDAVAIAEELLASLKENVGLLSMIAEVICVNNPPPNSLEILRGAREAIAKAEARP